jgi:hypothetical protein
MKIETVSYLCDICGAETSPENNKISFSKRIQYIYGGDVEKIGITGEVKCWNSHASWDGAICDKCKIEYLKLYIDELENNTKP